MLIRPYTVLDRTEVADSFDPTDGTADSTRGNCLSSSLGLDALRRPTLRLRLRLSSSTFTLFKTNVGSDDQT